MNYFRLVCLVAVAAALLALPALGDSVLTDGSFSNVSFSSNSFSTSPATVSVTSVICVSCGNSGSGVSVTGAYSNLGDAGFLTMFVDQNLVYNPSTQGAITSLSVSVDHNLIASNFTSPLGGGPVSFTTGFLPMVFQDGNFYRFSFIPGPNLNFTYDGVNPGGGSTGYTTLSATGLTQDNFVLFDLATETLGTAHPNFSGDPIEFGIEEFQHVSFPPSVQGTLNLASDYDNLSYQISSTPEPSALLLLAGGLPALLIRLRRRK